MIYQELQCGEI